MLDIAYYLNDEKVFEKSELEVEENCAPHYDPGLLSLSVLSTHRGLELYDPVKEEWVPHLGDDKSLAVLWCGEAAQQATNGLLRPAVHRVIRQLDKPRLAIWYEICMFKQVPSLSRPLIRKLIKLKTPPESISPKKKAKKKNQANTLSTPNSKNDNSNETERPIKKCH